MEGSFGILGIRNTRLTVDGKIVFESDVDSIPDFVTEWLIPGVIMNIIVVQMFGI